MQEERVCSSAHIRSHSSSDIRIDHFGPVKVKEEPPDSDDESQALSESHQRTAFVQQVIGKEIAPGFVINVIL